MNDEARDLLAAAGLRGHRQVRGTMHDDTRAEGECALGVLHLAMHATRTEAIRCWQLRSAALGNPCYGRLWMRFDLLDDGQVTEILRRNDELGQDFLTISRKAGTDA